MYHHLCLLFICDFYFSIFVIFFLNQDEFCTFMQLEYAEKEDSYLRSKEVRENTVDFCAKIMPGNKLLKSLGILVNINKFTHENLHLFIYLFFFLNFGKF